MNAQIKTAVDHLDREGKRATVTAIATCANVSRNSVYRYLKGAQSEG